MFGARMSRSRPAMPYGSKRWSVVFALIAYSYDILLVRLIGDWSWVRVDPCFLFVGSACCLDCLGWIVSTTLLQHDTYIVTHVWRQIERLG